MELRYKAEIAVEINELKKQRNAVILGHNYMEPALFHSIPDFTGDSLDLSRKAAQTDKDVIVFCGVRFMAETAKILNPTKDRAAAGRQSRLLAGRIHHRRGCARPEGEISRRAGGDLCQHLRGRESRVRYLLHLQQCRGGGRFAPHRYGHLPAG